MYIFEKYLYFSSFEAGNCVSNSSFKWRNIQLKQFSRTRANHFLLLLLLVRAGDMVASSSGFSLTWFNFIFSGSFLIISLPDLMRYVKGLRDDAIIPNTRGKYTHWKEKYLMKGHEDKHILEIYRSVVLHRPSFSNLPPTVFFQQFTDN